MVLVLTSSADLSKGKYFAVKISFQSDKKKKTPESNAKEKVGKCVHTYLRSNTGLEVISNTYVPQDICENILLTISLKLISHITLFVLMEICTVEYSFPKGKEIRRVNSLQFYSFTFPSF